jgi:hypothetical protein
MATDHVGENSKNFTQGCSNSSSGFFFSETANFLGRSSCAFLCLASYLLCCAGNRLAVGIPVLATGSVTNDIADTLG